MILKLGRTGIEYEIDDNAVVADVGSGNLPLKGATISIDRDVEVSPDRDNNALVIPDNKLILCDIEKGIPLPDKCCDFVYAAHILEHIKDPAAFCNELSRIGEKGYIETPGFWQDVFRPCLVHRNYVIRVFNTLVIIKISNKQFIPENKFLAWAFDIIRYNIFQGMETKYFWKDKVKFVVV